MAALSDIDLTDEKYEGMMVADGFDDAIIGTASQFGQDTVLAYNVDKVIEILMNRDGMPYEDALEFFSFNIEGAYVGDGTPVWIHAIEGW